MKKIVVCLLILLLAVSLCLIFVPKIEGQLSSIKVLGNYGCYYDSYGYFIVVGEVQNTGPDTVSSVIIGAVLTFSDGTQAEASAQAWVENLIPQQKAPFYLEFDSLGTSYWIDGEVIADFIILQAEATSNYLYSDVVVTNDQGVVAKDGAFWVTGELKNTGNQEAKNVQVIATFFNDQGTIVGVGHTDLRVANSLAPLETMSFEVGAFDVNQTSALEYQKIASYSLLVQLTGPVLQGEAPTIVVTPSPGPIVTEAPGSLFSVPISQIIVYVGVIIIVTVVIVVVMLLIKKNSVNPSGKTKNAVSKHNVEVKHKK
ncbi:MAG: FxLYD domain-containing protein [Nitrososphaerota archaeon]|jgi:hypothetical protein|nr:FxLYD domain-containing protein [Nitrososphaerota archaeon]